MNPSQKKHIGLAAGAILLAVLAYSAFHFRYLLDSDAEKFNKSINQIIATRYAPDPKKPDAWVDDVQMPHFSISMCEKQTIEIRKQPHVLFAMCGNAYSGQDNMAPGRIDYFLLKLQDAKVSTVAQWLGQEHGNYGNPGKVKVVRLGKDFYGFSLDESVTKQGNVLETRSLIIPGKKGFSKAAVIQTRQDNSQTIQCTENPDACSTIDMTVRIDNSKADAAIYPIFVKQSGEVSGTPVSGEFELKFDNKAWRYKMPKELS